ncbi:hypothetical protein [Zobellia galactanivorans]|uniref:hypothetical protein n=1 Tax=Zobellia galactanivorans (strain DSM 12802 / CCUG 47099 / CIP 106680 / NCIMB 13871 / Dsij) TaxID=63186 RepID=UPI001C0766BA|nr:hypothetical protein [Zobellia galactanivorans]MBU3028348.1 hypothetical protein [Zobellia galactanivorans]
MIISNEIKSERSISYLKKGVWLYFLLLIFEGALRKWVLPSLSDALLIVRDPVVLWMIYYSWKKNIIPQNVFLTSMIGLGALGIITALLFGHGNLFVALYGARIYLLHFPLIFIIGRVFDENDVIKMGKVLLYISIPMTVLIALQFYSPQSAWVNRGVGGDMEGAGFSGALGYYRPPGTFSFTMGTTLFYSCVAPLVFYFWFSSTKINKLLLILATIALVASIPLSISRGLFYSIVLSFLFVVTGLFFDTKKLNRLIFVVILLIALGVFLSNFEMFRTPVEVISTRFEQANEIEGGVSNSLVDRVFGYMFRAFTDSGDIPFFGYGMGMGTNVGSQLLVGDRVFLISEMEFGRLIGEMGLFIGTAMILVRLTFALRLSWLSIYKLRKGNLLPWLLLSVGLLNLVQGQWASPMNLGFSVLVLGLVLAIVSNKPLEKKTKSSSMKPTNNIKN